MKTLKRIFAMTLAIMMVMGLSVAAFAENSDGESYTKGSITIKNPQKNNDGSDVEYKAYKIFDVTYDLGGEGATDDKYAYTIAKGWVDDVVAYATPAEPPLADNWTTTTANGLTVTKVLDKNGTTTAYNVTIDDTFSAADFGEKMALNTSDKTATNSDIASFATDTVSGNLMAKDLDLGYYMIQPNSANALVSLTTTDKDVTVSDKNEKPVVDKKIVESNYVCGLQESAGHVHTAACGEEGTYTCGLEVGDGAHTHTDACKETDHTTASVGDKVEFELDTKVPDMTGYETYFFVMNDTMSKGLTFNDDVAITLGGETVSADKYTVKVTNNEDGSTNIRIVFKDMKQYWSNDEALDKAGQPIVIKYSATVDEDAVMGTDGNTNTAKIEYSNNPNIVPEWTDHEDPGDPDDPKDPKYKHNENDETTDDPFGESVPDEVTVYTSELDITKVDANGGAALTGAKFKIEGEKLNVSIVNKTIFEEDNENGTWYRLKNGTYTEDSPEMNGENKTTYAEMGETFVPVEYAELTGEDAVPGVGLYFSEDNGMTKTLITDGNKDSVPAGAKIYQPTYNTPGLFVNTGTADAPVWVEVTKENAAQYTSGTFYKATVWKQSDLYEDTTKKYVKVEVIDKTNTGAGKYTAEGFVGENGVITFGGLAEGTYKITELIAPDGYNLLKAPIEVDVSLVQDPSDATGKTYKFQATTSFQKEGDDPISEADGHISFNVENNSGTELPETGGIGTTIFYVVGGLLLAGAGVLLITRKRMSEEEN